MAVERARLFVSTSWLRADSIVAQVELVAPEVDFDSEQFVSGLARLAKSWDGEIVLPSSILNGSFEWMSQPQIRALSSRLRIQLQMGEELELFSQGILKSWVECGFGIDLLLDRSPCAWVEQFAALVPTQNLKIVYCQNHHFRLQQSVIDRLSAIDLSWRLWFAPQSSGNDLFYTSREAHQFLLQNPELKDRILIYDSADGSALSDSSAKYFHDFETDPMDFESATVFQRLLLKDLSTSAPTEVGWFTGFLFYFLRQPILNWPKALGSKIREGAQALGRFVYHRFWRPAIYGGLWRRVFVAGFYWKVLVGIYGFCRRFIYGFLWRDLVVAGFYWKVLVRANGFCCRFLSGIQWQDVLVTRVYSRLLYGVLWLRWFVDGYLWRDIILVRLCYQFLYCWLWGRIIVVHFYRHFIGHWLRFTVLHALAAPFVKIFWFCEYQYRTRMSRFLIGRRL